MQWWKWFIFLNMFLYCKIIISFLELFPATFFLSILQNQLARRNTSIPTKLKKCRHMTFMMMSSNDGQKISEVHVFSPPSHPPSPPPSLEFFWGIFWENISQKYNNLWLACQIWFKKSQNCRVKLYYTKLTIILTIILY